MEIRNGGHDRFHPERGRARRQILREAKGELRFHHPHAHRACIEPRTVGKYETIEQPAGERFAYAHTASPRFRGGGDLPADDGLSRARRHHVLNFVTLFKRLRPALLGQCIETVSSEARAPEQVGSLEDRLIVHAEILVSILDYKAHRDGAHP
ncbi:MAG: hypothetical protein WD044_02955 [Dongiaceae bacterium]